MLRVILVPAPQSGLDPATESGLARLSQAAGIPLVYLRAMSGGGHLLATAERVSPSVAGEMLQRLAADPAIAQIEEDQRVTHQAAPIDQ